MQNGASPHFSLTVRAWLAIIFLVGGLGEEKQQNALCEVSNLPLCNF
jgi:hypothetical protein